MLRVLVLAACVLGSLCGPVRFDSGLDVHWKTYKATYNKLYSQSEEPYRRSVWEENIAYIRNHNLEADMGKHTFTLGMNEHGDMTADEYAKFFRGFIATNSTAGSLFIAPSNAEVPDMVDWRDKGYVTPIKNQAQCGSCWAFSAVGSLEGQHFKKTGKLVSLSEQNLVDCSMKEGNHGCHGGNMDAAFKYIKMNGGIDTEESYPYTAKDGKCHFKRSDVGATCTGYVDIPSGNEDALRSAVATVGPIAVAIDAGHKSFQLYKRGVYHESACSSMRLDHGVVVVGYGSEMGSDYWIVKNSWGPSWGNKGYIQMSRDRNNNCGIATRASYPLV